MLRDELALALAAFATSAIGTLRETLGVEAAFRGREAGPARECITVAIDVTGDVRRVTWVFPIELAHEMARRLVGETSAELAELAAIELANILTGRAVARLEQRGLRLELAVPHISAVVLGASVKLITAVGAIEIAFDPHEVAA